MSEFSSLINQKVIVSMEIDEDEHIEIEGVIKSVLVDDFYFHEKNEPVYVTASVFPTGDISEDIDLEELVAVPLSNIRKAY